MARSFAFLLFGNGNMYGTAPSVKSKILNSCARAVPLLRYPKGKGKFRYATQRGRLERDTALLPQEEGHSVAFLLLPLWESSVADGDEFGVV